MEDNVEDTTLETEDNRSFLDVELETLQSIYITEIIIQKQESFTTVSIDLHPATADNLHEQFVKMTLILNVKEGYPQVIPEIDIRNPRGLSDEKINSITENLIEIAEIKKGNSMIFEMIEAAKDDITAENRPCEECAICLYSFHEEDVFTKTECYHYFHSHCLARYSKNFLLSEEESISEEEKTKNQLLCPVCRLPIHFEDSEEIYPIPKSGDEQFELTESILDLQKKMSELYSKQVEKGGIIDIEAEKNKFLLEIAHVPSVTEHTNKSNDSDVKTNDVVDASSLPMYSSSGENETEFSQSSILKNAKDVKKSVKSYNESAKKYKTNEEKNTFKDPRGERIGRDKNFIRDRNERYNGTRGNNRYGNRYNDQNSYQRNNRYNERRNNWYEREPPSDRYENERRNDRYRDDRKNDRYGNDGYNVDTRNDRYSYDRRNDRYNSDARNERYVGDRRNERYDRRVEKYDQRHDRFDDRKYNRFERENFQNDFKNGSFHRRNRNQSNNANEDDVNQKSNHRLDRPESFKNENTTSCDIEGAEMFTEIDKQDDWKNEETEDCGNEKSKDFENDPQENGKDQLEEFKSDEKISKSNERKYQPRNRRNERQDQRLNGNFSDTRYNNRHENQFDTNRKNYRQNGSRTEFRDFERKNNRFGRGRGNRYQNSRNYRNVNSGQRELRCENDRHCVEEELSTSPEIHENEKVPSSLCECDSEITQFVESTSKLQTNNSIKDKENDVSSCVPFSETSNNHKDSFSDKNHGANRTNRENYKKFNYGHNTNYQRGKKFNPSNTYQKNGGFHLQQKHSNLHTLENYDLNPDDINYTKNYNVKEENATPNEVSDSRRNIKNDGVDIDDSQSFRKNYRRTNSANNKRGQPRSYKDCPEENSRGEEEIQQELHSTNHQKDSPKYIPQTSNRRYPQRKYKEDNYEKPSNIQNKSSVETNDDLMKNENSVNKIPVEEPATPAASKSSDVKNSVPTSNFLPPLSSVAPPPGFQNPSRKIVYGLAAANPPPGFNRS